MVEMQGREKTPPPFAFRLSQNKKNLNIVGAKVPHAAIKHWCKVSDLFDRFQLLWQTCVGFNKDVMDPV